MNFNTVVSLPVSKDLSAYTHAAVKMTSTGLDLAGPSDRILGTMVRSNVAPQVLQDAVGNAITADQAALGMAADVFLSAGNGEHFFINGSSTLIALGDELEQWPNGRFAAPGGVITGTGANTGDLVTITNHGFINGTQLIATVQTGGSDLTLGLAYFVISATTNTFQLSLTSGGAAVALTADYTVLTFRPAFSNSNAAVAVNSCPASSVGGIVRAIVFSSNGGGVEVLQAARTLTAADNGKTFLLALAGGFTVTLPANTNAGFKCTFRVKVAPTTAYIIAAATADTMAGCVLSQSGAAEDTETDFTGDQLNFVAAAAVKGDRADIFIDGYGVHAHGFTGAAGGITITG